MGEELSRTRSTMVSFKVLFVAMVTVGNVSRAAPSNQDRTTRTPRSLEVRENNKLHIKDNPDLLPCGEVAYDRRTRLCCAGTVRLPPAPAFKCCGTALYHSRAFRCCGKIVLLSQDLACCGSKHKAKIYRTEEELCCRGHVMMKNTPASYCCHGGVCEGVFAK
ncbi:hypothetical protein LSAT2_010082 [Lamellibrachia satsuma]|nr:hypothetical protein LSAT2_010082 [Lamellibrachia satsuma]